MSLRPSATRYARALFDIALRDHDPNAIERELSTLAEVMTSHAELKRALETPGVPQTARVGIVRAVAESAHAAAPVVRLLTMLAERGRLELLPDLVDVYRERLMAHNNVVHASITTASTVAPDTLRSLEHRLAAGTGKQIRLQVHVDPALIGGVVTRIGSTVYDGSLRTQLQKIQQRLLENA
jgi:F-type H+-transporting ATPase subunit delta